LTTALFPTLVLVVAFALAAGLVPAAGRLARRFGVLDAPGPRKVHGAPTPRIGGIAVFAAFTLVVLAGYLGVPILSRLPWVATRLAGPLAMLQEAYRVEAKLLAMLLGGALVFGVGLLELVAWVLRSTGAQTPYFMNPEVNFQVAITAIVLLVAVGVIAGLVPALRAAKITPTEAMRAD